MGPTVANHAGFISVKLDYFCYFGAELNFFVELWRTKKKLLYKSWNNGLLYSYTGGWVIDRTQRER